MEAAYVLETAVSLASENTALLQVEAVVTRWWAVISLGVYLSRVGSDGQRRNETLTRS